MTHSTGISLLKRWWLPIGLAGVVPIAFLGCATMSALDCVTADWKTLGEQDGAEGQPLSKMEERRKACIKHAVRLDDAAYKVGREAGLAVYCTEQGGFTAGQNGSFYHGVCTGVAYSLFGGGYARGQTLWHAVQEFRGAEYRVSEIEKRVDRLERANIELSQLISDADTPDEDRDRHQDQIKENTEKIRRLLRDLETEIRSKESLRSDLRRLEDKAESDGFVVIRRS